MTRLSYLVPPLNDAGEPSTQTFVELPPVAEAALLCKDGAMLPGLVVGADMAITLSWKQTRDLHRLLGDWLGFARWQVAGSKSETFPGAIVGSEELK